jgi:hypothetical protein
VLDPAVACCRVFVWTGRPGSDLAATRRTQHLAGDQAAPWRKHAQVTSAVTALGDRQSGRRQRPIRGRAVCHREVPPRRGAR